MLALLVAGVDRALLERSRSTRLPETRPPPSTLSRARKRPPTTRIRPVDPVRLTHPTGLPPRASY